jgi:hypothetical protein
MNGLRKRAVEDSRRPKNEPPPGHSRPNFLGMSGFPKDRCVPTPAGINDWWSFKQSSARVPRIVRKPPLLLIVLMGLVLAVAPGTAICQTLTVKDSENPETLVNTGTTTALRLKVLAPDRPLLAGTNCEIRVELHNTGYRVEVIYMPALTLRPAFHPDKATAGVADEFGPPMLFGRQAAKDEGLNYVVLMGGDYYGRTYRWVPPASGAVKFHAVYSNTNAGPTRRLAAWRGELRAESPALRSLQK